jgi:CheY-like chemotaxis protein
VAVILIVDDEAEVSRSIARVLRRRGYTVRIAGSGAEALGMLDEVDVLLTDVRMPGMSGLELVTAVKAARPAIRCYVMSGDTGVESIAGGAPMVDGYLGKPFTHVDLVALIGHSEEPPRSGGGG